jgi:hypothetical protein
MLLKKELSPQDLMSLESIVENPEVEAYTAYCAASILFHAVNDSKEYELILQQAQQRFMDTVTNQEVIWRGNALK